MNFKLWLEQNQIYIRGEYWIHEDGSTTYADGDIGDMTHEGIVIEAVIREVMESFGIYNGSEFMDWDEIKKEILESLKADFTAEEREKYKFLTDHSSEGDELIVSKLTEMGDKDAMEKMSVIYGSIDAREYAMQHWNWKAVRDNNIDTWTLTPADMKTIAYGLGDIEQEMSDDAEFHISVYRQSKNFTITMRELEAGRIGGPPSAPSVAGR